MGAGGGVVTGGVVTGGVAGEVIGVVAGLFAGEVIGAGVGLLAVATDFSVLVVLIGVAATGGAGVGVTAGRVSGVGVAVTTLASPFFSGPGASLGATSLVVAVVG